MTRRLHELVALLKRRWRKTSVTQAYGSNTNLSIEHLEGREMLSTVSMTDHDQLLLELVNRARMDPVSEVGRHTGVDDLNDGLNSGTISNAPKQPLAPNQQLVDTALAHSADMLAVNYFSHTNPQGKGPADRAAAAGYPGTVGENIAWGGTTSTLVPTDQLYKRHRDLFVSPEHRKTLMSEEYREVGMGVQFGQFTTAPPITQVTIHWNAIMITESFGWTNSDHFITGVAYADNVIDDDFYSVGESRSGLSITATNTQSGQSYSTTTGSSGGYGVQVPNGAYTVTASGGGLANPYTFTNILVSNRNVKVDFDTTTASTTPVNSPPIAADETANTPEDSAVSTNVVANDFDPNPGDTLQLVAGSARIRSATLDFNGTPLPIGNASVTQNGNHIIFDPQSEFDLLEIEETVTVLIDYEITDSTGLRDSAVLTVKVHGINSPPVATPDSVTIAEDTVEVTVDVVANDTDVDTKAALNLVPGAQQILSMKRANGTSIPVSTASLSVSGNSITFRPGSDFEVLAEGESATVLIGYSVRDITSETSSGVLTVFVNGTQGGHAPVAVDDIANTMENASVTTNVIANDTDGNAGDTLQLVPGSASIRSVTLDFNGTALNIGNATFVQNGNSITFDPKAEFDLLEDQETVTVLIDYVVTDSEGLTDTGTLTVKVHGINSAPVAVPDSRNSYEDTNAVADVIANDTDVDTKAALHLLPNSARIVGAIHQNGNPITLVNSSVTSSGNVVTFSPGTDFEHLSLDETATVTIGYTVYDITSTQGQGIFTVTVRGKNDGPTATPDVRQTPENANVVADVVVTDSDIDRSDTLRLIPSVTRIASMKRSDGSAIQPKDASISISNNVITFHPRTNFDFLKQGETATVVINYTVADNNGAAAQSTLTVTVKGSSDNPVAIPDAASTTETQSVEWNVIQNDTDADSSGQLFLVPQSVKIANATNANGTAMQLNSAKVSVAGDRIIFSPGTDFVHLNQGETATVVVNYLVADETFLVNSGELTITVAGIANATTGGMGIVGRAGTGGWYVADVADGKATTTNRGKWVATVDWQDVKTLDFDGDGFTDIVGRGNGSWWLAEAQDGKFFTTRHVGDWSTSTTWSNVHVGDFNGDGRGDLAGRHGDGSWWVSTSNGQKFVTSRWAGWSTATTWSDVQVIDPDGDGIDDIIGRAGDGTWWLAKSNGTKFQNQAWGQWSTQTSWQHVNVADIDGDGRQDIVGRDANTGRWWVGRSNGSRFVTQYWGHWSTAVNWNAVTVADVNGDGRDDIVGQTNGAWWTAKSNGSRFTMEHWGASLHVWSDVHAMDVDNDGDDDLIGRNAAGYWWVFDAEVNQFKGSQLTHWSTNVEWSDIAVGRFG